jgi:glutamine amidotransferase-like uncharacterized protein
MKLIWRVQPVPTGRYRSFEKRGWPEATFDNQDKTPAAMIACEVDYKISIAKSGNHPELTVRVRVPSETSWKWATLKKRAANMREAKDLVDLFYKANPQYIPS